MSNIDSSTQGSTASAIQSSAHSSSTITPFKFHGIGGEFFGIWIVNMLLTMVTLGIYSAWAKVRTHCYFYSNTELGGDRFEYLATPIQILIGRIIAVVLLIGWAILNAINPIIAIALAVILMFATPFLAVRNMRFDARMTRFRNVRFNFEGSYAGAYLQLLVKPLLAYLIVIAGPMAIAAGSKFLSDELIGVGVVVAVLFFFAAMIFCYAWVSAGIAQYMVNGYRYGTKAFQAELNIREYMKIALKAMALFMGAMVASTLIAFAFGFMGSIVELIKNGFKGSDAMQGGEAMGFMMLIVSYFFMLAVSMVIAAYVKVCTRNYMFNETKLDGELQMRSNMALGSFLALVVTNFLLVIVTFGFGIAWAEVRSAKYMASVTEVEGNLSLVHAHDHNEQSDAAIADEVAGAFDINIGIV
ncbi:YjgN family protein [Shewanella sp. TC10]|uniref:YjgN family protein n=1 Tax=Shewanella sp. TC10 TaxID=1419739 RepID=UPI00129E06C1|nr:YjgN family protein [Shewanella sp. TC10]